LLVSSDFKKEEVSNMNIKLIIGCLIGSILLGVLCTPSASAYGPSYWFYVNDINSGDPIGGAVVSFSGTTSITGPSGHANFIDANTEDSTYSITKNGYNTASGEASFPNQGLPGGLQTAPFQVYLTPQGSAGCAAGTIMMISPLAILAACFIFFRRF
jgi:hypothetical protein